MVVQARVASVPYLSARTVRAHALKNCLSVVYAVSYLIDDELSDRGRERLARLRAAAVQMKSLIEEDLRPASGAREGREESGQQLIEIEDLVRAVLLRNQDCAERARVQLVVTCGPGRIRGNAGELAEALHNLVSNAIAATPSEGVVDLTTATTADGGQEWTVTDTGCGMPPELLGNIGRPFYTTREGGSGIGFVVARDVLRRHGGRLTIESQAGSGTTVRMFLPPERCA